MNKITKSLTEEKELNYNENNGNSQLNNIKKHLNNNNNNKKIKEVHPLDFYTLGIVHDSSHYPPNFCSNRAFQSSSNDLITRNIFSLNSPKYENLKKDKNYSKLSQQNINENNYLKPLEVYSTFKKYSLNSNASNRETYNIAREKIFAKSNISLIKKGLNLTYNNFINNKKRLIKEYSERKINKAIKDKINDKIMQRTKTQINYTLNNHIKNNLGLDNSNDNINNINKKYEKSINYTNPNDYTKKILKGNTLYFDKNNKQFIRYKKNWWIPDK